MNETHYVFITPAQQVHVLASDLGILLNLMWKEADCHKPNLSQESSQEYVGEDPVYLSEDADLTLSAGAQQHNSDGAEGNVFMLTVIFMHV